MQLKLDQIRQDGGTQPRAQVDMLVVSEYAEEMKNGGSFPAITVFFDGSTYWLADGFHRLAAARQTGQAAIEADVKQGTIDDARWFSYAANKSHGLRRSNEDKRRAVEAALQHPRASGLSNVQIAAHCGVSEGFVRKLKPIFVQYEDSAAKTVTRNGTTYEMNTAKIGKASEPALAPAKPLDTRILSPDPDEPGKMKVDHMRYCRLCGSKQIAALDFFGRPKRQICFSCRLTHEQWDLNPPAQPKVEDRSIAVVEPPKPKEEVFSPMPPKTDVQPETPNKLSLHHSSKSAEHYTPPEIVDAVIEVMGAITLDPCSNSKTQPAVRAGIHFTLEDDGLSKEWFGTVYMNPPYGREIGDWVTKLATEHDNGKVMEAIVLVPARPDTQWWKQLRDYPVCFVEGRLQFIGNDDPAPFPSAIFYLGTEIGRFWRVFSQFGDVWQRIEPGMFAE